MVRPDNIDPVAHTADFRCDHCKASDTGVDLNTKTQYGIEMNVGENLGTGNDVQTVFSFSKKSMSLRAVYLDGVFQSSGYTDDADGITFSVPPASGVVVTADYGSYTSTLTIRVHCAEVISGGCGVTSFFPTNDEANPLGYALGQAKSA